MHDTCQLVFSLVIGINSSSRRRKEKEEEEREEVGA